MSAKPLFVNGWEVTGIRSAEKFFSALTEILSLPVNLSFEGTSISHDVQELLASNVVTPSRQIPPGTIWPKATVFHVRADEHFVHRLTVLAGRHAEAEVCDHFHAYSENQALMQWYDAFDLPLLIEESVSERSLQEFCGRVGAKYACWHATK
jgi:hypothetical protein